MSAKGSLEAGAGAGAAAGVGSEVVVAGEGKKGFFHCANGLRLILLFFFFCCLSLAAADGGDVVRDVERRDLHPALHHGEDERVKLVHSVAMSGVSSSQP